MLFSNYFVTPYCQCLQSAPLSSCDTKSGVQILYTPHPEIISWTLLTSAKPPLVPPVTPLCELLWKSHVISPGPGILPLQAWKRKHYETLLKFWQEYYSWEADTVHNIFPFLQNLSSLYLDTTCKQIHLLFFFFYPVAWNTFSSGNSKQFPNETLLSINDNCTCCCTYRFHWNRMWQRHNVQNDSQTTTIYKKNNMKFLFWGNAVWGALLLIFE